jgi:hypothetical protein
MLSRVALQIEVARFNIFALPNAISLGPNGSVKMRSAGQEMSECPGANSGQERASHHGICGNLKRAGGGRQQLRLDTDADWL